MKIGKLLCDIRFWIIFFFLLRLTGISDPPLEVAHNWRQTTVIMVSRNFYETGSDILYPRIDFAGEKTGITGMEFPILNYLIYLVAKVFGYQHWYGRLINLLVSSFGLWFFYKLVRKYFEEQASFYATIILIVSIWFQFSRKIMPDTFAMSLIIAGIYYGTNYLDAESKQKRYWFLLIYCLLIMAGALSKLPSAFLLIGFGLHFFNKDISLNRKLVFSIVSLLSLIPVIIWYFYWVPYLVKQYGFWHFFMGKNILVGFNEIIEFGLLSLSRFYDTALKYTGFAVFMFGLVMALINREKKVYLLFILTMLSFSVIMSKAGFTFSHHSYYIVPFVPVMALVAGYGLTKIKSTQLAFTLLIAISIEGIANQQHDFWIKDNNRRIMNLEKDLDKVSKRTDLILINSGSYPTPMYFAHRKGWVDTNEKIKDENFINDLRSKGLAYIVILKRSFGSEIVLDAYEKKLENEDYCIYALKTAQAL